MEQNEKYWELTSINRTSERWLSILTICLGAAVFVHIISLFYPFPSTFTYSIVVVYAICCFFLIYIKIYNQKQLQQYQKIIQGLTKEIQNKNILIQEQEQTIQNTHEKLHKTETYYQLLSEKSSDLVCLYDHQTRKFSSISSSVEAFLGYKPNELLETPVANIFHPDELQQIFAEYKEVLQGKHLAKYQHRFKTKNGEYIWVETWAYGIKDPIHETLHVQTSSRNIGESKRLESIIKVMQEIAKVGAWQYKPHTATSEVFWTEGMYTIHELPEDTIPSLETITKFYNPQAKKTLAEAIEKAIRTGTSYELELELTTDQNTRKWVKAIGKAFQEDDNGYTLYGAVLDISDKKKEEKFLIRKQHELRTFIENAPVAIAMFDKRMRYMAASDNWYKEYQINENVIGKGHYQIFPNLPEEWKQIYERCLQGAIEKRNEDRLITTDNKEEWIRWEVRPWYTNNNDIGGIIILTESITELKKAEQASKIQKERMEKIYQLTSIGDQNINTQIENVLQTVTEMLGLQLGSLNQIDEGECRILACYAPHHDLKKGQLFPLSETYCVLVHQENKLMAMHDTRNSIYGELLKNKAYDLQAYIASPVWVKGKPFGALQFSASYTLKEEFSQGDKDLVQLVAQWMGTTLERELYNKELILAKEEAEKASSAKADFLSTMSHEIRTPMNAVIGMTHILLQEDPKAEQIDHLKTLEFSANNLLSLINDILDVSKIESGKIDFEKIDFNIKELAKGIKEALKFKAEEKRLDLKLKIDLNIPEMLIGDPVRLHQILNNLVSNALKFTEKGSIEVTLDLAAQNDEEVEIVFSVIDTGIGIPADRLDAIFEAFSQASAETTRKYGGTGLGLTITKKLVELQGGKIQIASELNQGSSFSFNLKFARSKADATKFEKKTDYASFESLGGAKVLLVEDNLINLKVATKFLEKWDLIIDIAHDGLEACQKVEKNDYDIILMDIQMPKMDGYEATKTIRTFTDLRKKAIPIIALTASALIGVKDQVIQSGMDDFITKPFNPMELYSKIRKYINIEKMAALKEAQLVGDSAQVEGFEERLEMYYQKEVHKAKLVNYDKILEMAEGSEDFLQTITKICIQDFQKFKEDYKEALLKYDIDKLKFIAHRSKSSITLLSLTSLETEIKKGEDLLAQADSNEVSLQNSIDTIVKLCDKVIAELQEKL